MQRINFLCTFAKYLSFQTMELNREYSNKEYKRLGDRIRSNPKEVAEDESKKGQDDMQKLVDKYVKLVDTVKAGKEKEIMEV